MTKEELVNLQETYIKNWKTNIHDPSASNTINAEFYALMDRYPLMKPTKPMCFVYTGWWPALEKAFVDISFILQHNPEGEFYIRQIKEKFGGLRFYADIKNVSEDAQKAIRDIISHTESTCSKQCEICGDFGRNGTSKSGWMRTLCEHHVKWLDEIEG